jgi:hypothetical protein
VATRAVCLSSTSAATAAAAAALVFFLCAHCLVSFFVASLNFRDTSTTRDSLADNCRCSVVARSVKMSSLAAASFASFVACDAF